MIKLFKEFFLVLLVFNFDRFCEAQQNVDCSEAEALTTIISDPIALTFEGIITSYKNVTINEIESIKNNDFDKLYISARLEQNATLAETSTKNLIIYTTEHFTNYSREQTMTRIALKIQLGCQSGRQRTIIFFQSFEDKNYFAPEFTQQVYEIVLPTPIYAGFDLTFLTEIAAKDYDLLRNRIHFTSPNSTEAHIIVGIKNSTHNHDNKTFYASLVMDQVLTELDQEISFPIMAIDSGVPPKFSLAQVIIRPDPRSLVKTKPIFENQTYFGEIYKNLTMSPLQVRLKPETYSSNVSVSLTGNDRGLFSIKNNRNVFDVQLATQLNKTFLQNKRFFEFEIKAQLKSSREHEKAVVVIKTPTIKENFHFEKIIFEGIFNESARNLTIEDITFDEFAYRDEIEFYLSGWGSSLFEVQHQNQSIKINLKNSTTTLADLANITFLNLQINAKWDTYQAAAAIILSFTKPKPVELHRSSMFEKPLYVGKFLDHKNIEIEAIKVLDSNFTEPSDLQLSLNGSASGLFDVTKDDNVIGLHLKNSTNTSSLPFDSNILLTLNGKVQNLEGKTDIILQEATPRQSFNSIQFFDKLWYKGRLVFENDRQVLHFDPIPVREGLRVNKMSFYIIGEERSHFEISGDANDNKVHFKLQRPIEEDIVADRAHLIFDFHVRHMDLELNNTLVVVIAFPKTACVVPQNGSMGGSMSGGMGSSMSSLKFGSPEYVFTWSPNKIGSIANITAITSEASVDNIRYSLKISNDHLRRRILIDAVTGELKVLSLISPGGYSFEILANNGLTNEKASAMAQLNVETMIQCDDKSSKVANAFLVKHIEEEKAHENIFNMTLGKCSFEILSVYPNDKEYVLLNRLTSTLSTKAIDREDPVFANMTIPQIQVKLQLHCDFDANQRSLSPGLRRAKRYVNESSLVSLSDIPYSQDITALTLIIDDINDNTPVFLVPKESTFLAYPSSDISFELFPENLIKVEATDADEGLNARIHFSIEENDHFSIDAVTGVVYPKAKALHDTDAVELVIKASDREGAENGLSSSIRINVKSLSSDYFTLLTFNTNELRTIENIVEDLVNQTGYRITIVKHATITKTNKEAGEKRQMLLPKAGENEIVQQAWIYAFAKEEPIPCVDFMRKILNGSGNDTKVAMESYSQVGLVSNHSDLMRNINSDTTGYIVGICLLSCLCMALLGFIYWRFFPENFFCNNLRPDRPGYCTNTDVGCSTYPSNGGRPGNRNRSKCGATEDNFENSAKCFEPCVHNNGMDEVNLNDVWTSSNSKH